MEVCLTATQASYLVLLLSPNQYQNFREQIIGNVYCRPQPDVAT